MSYSNYAEIESAIRNRVPFRGNSARGELVKSVVYGYQYLVFSYGTLVGTYGADERWVSESYYSKTTSRIQNICRRVWEV